VKLRLATVDVVVTRFCGTPSAHVYVCPNALWARDFAAPQTMLNPTFNGDNIVPRGNVNISELDVPVARWQRLGWLLTRPLGLRFGGHQSHDHRAGGGGTDQLGSLPTDALGRRGWRRLALPRTVRPTFTWLK
jgi:hypothetical protein